MSKIELRMIEHVTSVEGFKERHTAIFVDCQRLPKTTSGND